MNNNMYNNINNNMYNNMNNDIYNNMYNNMNNNMYNNMNNNKNNKIIKYGNDSHDINKLPSQLNYPHLLGLFNIGQSCYMNATIECLSNIKEISDVLLQPEYLIKDNSKLLTSVYSELLSNLFYPNKEILDKKGVEPTTFKIILGFLNPLFQGSQAGDSKDLIFFLIETLHEELNEGKIESENIPEIFDSNSPEISTNKNKMLQNFRNEFQLKNKSIISDTFYGITSSEICCDKCKKTKYTFQSFNIKIYNLKTVSERNPYKKKIDLFDAIISDQKKEHFQGDNLVYCDICEELNSAIYQQSIFSLPKVFIINLNRGKNKKDYEGEFEYPLIADFSKYVENKNNYLGNKYYLSGVITHWGESGCTGHFVAYCRNNENDNFICYNDDLVYIADTDDVLGKKKLDKNNDYSVTPYILFYHYCES